MSIILIVIGIVVVVILLSNFKNTELEYPNDIENSELLFREWETKFEVENSSEIRETFHTKVAGVTFSNNNNNVSRQQIIRKCSVGERLMLVPDLDNKHDKNAVKVCRANNEQIGYLKAELAPDISSLLVDYKSRVDAWITSINGQKILGVNLRIQNYEIKVRFKKEKRTKVEEIPYDSEIKMHRNSFERSMQAKALEKQGYIENAIEMYESIVNRGFDAPFSYTRLTILYRRRKEYDKEIDVIQKLIKMYKKEYGEHYDIINMEERLDKAKKLREKTLVK
jgi:tetratricopeptide (TPR) repeat protein